MRHASLPLLLLLALVAGAADVRAQAAPQVGTCTTGTAEAALDVNNVFGAVFNTGSLFFGNTLTNGDGYLVPKATGKSPIFASGIWVGGQVGGQLRVAGARYTNFNFWPGPLNAATGRPVNPASCAAYDRIYSVKRDDIRAYEAGGQFSADLTDWPYQLGAPVVDGDRNLNNYNLAGGDRPDIIGDQGLWWVMNDVGNVHAGTNTPPLGIEVQVLAFAFGRADALGSTTFYKYKIINKSGSTIENTYVSVFSDPDLGNAIDDYVGSDTAAGLGYVYNADNVDDGQYGVNPPAVGYDFFQGPIVPDGPDAGTGADTLGTTAFSYFINGGGVATTDPTTGIQIYNYQQGLWADASEMRAFGNGFQQTQGAVTKFAFPGDPVTNQVWSEPNNGTATPLLPGDRRLVVHSGPFRLNNGDVQDIVFGVVYARGTSNLSSITALRAADRLAQRAYDIDFDLPAPPPAPALCGDANRGTGTCLSASSENGQVSLTFGFPASSSNYLGQYEVVNGFIVGAPGVTDVTYNFEGFNIYRYPNSNFATEDRQLVATYDIVNGVTEVRDFVFDPTIGDNNIAILARGTDSGLQYSYTVDGLTNYTDYYYGITSYAYNEFSSPKIIESQPTNITVRPSGQVGGIRTQSAVGDSVTAVVNVQNGEGTIVARVVDPTALTGDTYNVSFFNNADGTLNYSIRNVTDGTVVLDGAAYFAQTGHSLEQIENIIVVDGLSFSVTGPDAPFRGIFEIDRQGAATSLLGTPNAVRPPTYLVGAQGSASNNIGDITDAPGGTTLLARLDFNDFLTTSLPNDYEVRWVDPQQGQAVLNRVAPARYLTCWEIGTATSNTAGPSDLQIIQAPIVNGLPRMPFQLWQIKPDGTETQMHLNVLDTDGDNCYSFDTAANTGAAPLAGFGYERMYGSKIPYVQSELANVADVYTRSNVNTAPNQAFGRMTVLFRAGGTTAAPVPSPATIPQAGTKILLDAVAPNQAGDSISFNTATVQRTTPTLSEQQAALKLIAAVPNPYYGQSGYETGNLSRVVRFTNLPAQTTTIRIYTVSGSLVQTLRKDGGSRSLDWNLTTVNNLPVASGMYLVHVDVEGVGETTLKLGIINRRSQVNVF